MYTQTVGLFPELVIGPLNTGFNIPEVSDDHVPLADVALFPFPDLSSHCVTDEPDNPRVAASPESNHNWQSVTSVGTKGRVNGGYLA